MSGRRLIDGREMLPPEPLEQTLSALDGLPDGEELVLLIHCLPHPLYAILDREGYVHADALQPDGTREIRIWRRSLRPA